MASLSRLTTVASLSALTTVASLSALTTVAALSTFTTVASSSTGALGGRSVRACGLMMVASSSSVRCGPRLRTVASSPTPVFGSAGGSGNVFAGAAANRLSTVCSSLAPARKFSSVAESSAPARKFTWVDASRSVSAFASPAGPAPNAGGVGASGSGNTTVRSSSGPAAGVASGSGSTTVRSSSSAPMGPALRPGSAVESGSGKITVRSAAASTAERSAATCSSPSRPRTEVSRSSSSSRDVEPPAAALVNATRTASNIASSRHNASSSSRKPDIRGGGIVVVASTAGRAFSPDAGSNSRAHPGQSNGWRTVMASARSGPVEIRCTGAPTSSDTRSR